MLLYELFTDINFSCTQTVGPQHAKFKTLVTVNGCDFEGTGKCKSICAHNGILIHIKCFRSVEKVVEECRGESGFGVVMRHFV